MMKDWVLLYLSTLTFLFPFYFSSVIKRNYFNNYSMNQQHHFPNNQVEIYLNDNNKGIYYSIIDLTSQYTWFTFFYTDDYVSNTSVLINENINLTHFDNVVYDGKEIEELIGFHNLPKVRLKLYTMIKNNGDQKQFRNILGMAYSFLSPKYSIIHQYKAEGLIDHLSFSIQSGNNYIYLGGIPEENTKDHFHSSYNVIGMNNSWNCNITEAVLVNGANKLKYSNKTSFITFITANNRYYVPKGFYELLMEVFYKKEIESNHYKFIIFNGKTFLRVGDGYETIHGQLVLLIDGYSYTIALRNLWSCHFFGCDLNIFENPYGDYWIFGNQFFLIIILYLIMKTSGFTSILNLVFRNMMGVIVIIIFDC